MLVTVVITREIVENVLGEMADRLDREIIVESLIAVTGGGGGTSGGGDKISPNETF